FTHGNWARKPCTAKPNRPAKPAVTPISGRPTQTWLGFSDGITSTWRSIHRPASTTHVNENSSAGFALLVLLSMPRNGIAKIIVNAANDSGRHGSSKRRNTHHVSSGMSAYQMGRDRDHIR